jgi:DNA (cytosine-5)-methyltransferase 1
VSERYVSLFSGAGGLDLGLRRAGFTPGLLCDESGPACSTLRAAMPASRVTQCDVHDLLNAGVIRELSDVVSTPLLVAGSPPVYGHGSEDPQGREVDPEDDAPQLLFRFMDAVAQARPAAFILEALPGLTGPRWGAVLGRLRKEAGSLGYDTFTPVIDAADYGVPQHKNRVFLTGMPRGCKLHLGAPSGRVSAGAALRALPAGTRDVPCPARVYLAPNPVLRNSPYSGRLLSGTGRMLDLQRVAPPVHAALGGNKTPVLDLDQLESGAVPWIERYHDWLWRLGGTPGEYDGTMGRMRRLSLRECAALQGFPPDYPFRGPATPQFRLAGSATPPPLAEAVGRAVMAGLA